jgi:hypothetical protein
MLRRRWGDRLFAFAPANDLSVVSRSLDLGDRRTNRKGQTEVEGGKVLGDEWAEHVVKNRSGIMLRASWVLPSALCLHLQDPSQARPVGRRHCHNDRGCARSHRLPQGRW